MLILTSSSIFRGCFLQFQLPVKLFHCAVEATLEGLYFDNLFSIFLLTTKYFFIRNPFGEMIFQSDICLLTMVTNSGSMKRQKEDDGENKLKIIKNQI